MMRNALWGMLFVVVAACGDNLKPNVPMDAAPDAPMPCGNGVVEGTEQCDDGAANGTEGARCTTTCNWVCLDDTWCADTEACNGAETCVDHACVAGTAEADGASCGTGKLCRNSVCTDAACGDQFVTGPNEECDDANTTGGDGCENNCKFSCVSTDNTRNCTPADLCEGQGTCNDTTHTCTPGQQLPDNSDCGGGKYCKAGVCTQPMCGNGMTEPGEQCDLGTANGTTGSGCKANCTFECVTPTTDCPAAPACQKPSCNALHTCENIADTALNGMSCGGNLVCNDGACVAPSAVCGNGVTETGEQCDFGSGSNGPGTGCESNCLFSCTVLPDSCTDGNPCNGTETCTSVTVNTKPGQKCTTTAAPAPGTSCGSGQICLGQVCKPSTCGDMFTDTGAGEQCDPPNGTTCAANCRNIVCGDGVRAGSEQCDDSNLINLDGCDSACRFEQCHRVIALSLGLPPNNQTSTFCPKNALGGALTGSLVQGQISSALTDGVNDGSITIALKALGLDDLTGVSEPSVNLGVLTGSPVAGTGYNGAMDLDWWYTTAPSVIDAMRNPTTALSGSITAQVINAGPSDISIMISLGGSPATLNFLRAKLRGTTVTATTPLASTGAPPGHLAAEHLDPALKSFPRVNNGELCGDVTAGSLNAVAAPSALSLCGYSATNTMLDVIVGGCFLGITATEPDSARVPGNTYDFQVGANKRVTGCSKNGGQAATLPECLSDAAYSAFFRFTTDRVIMK